MASLNVAEWTPDQVAEWMSGLGPSVERYAEGLKAQGLTGARLLTLRCDDLEYLGIRVIGHQELLLEAVEHLRNFQYECGRECVQQLALRVSVAGGGLWRATRAQDALETQTLADVARLVHAVKPLVCWLDRWPLCASAALAERKAALLKVCLEAATCAQRDRFADQPARTVSACAAAAAATADYIIQDVADPAILAPASLESVHVRQAGKPLGFALVTSACAHTHLAHTRFGSPAHASGHVHDGDEVVWVGTRCVLGWSGAAAWRACRAAAQQAPELALRLRRRGRPRPLPPAARLPPPDAPHDHSDDSDAPASPTQLHPDHTRMYPPKPRAAAQRRHTISCGSPTAKRPSLSIEQFWLELKEQKWSRGTGSAGMSPEPDDCALYRRDKAVSCSTGLELSPRPRTCLGVSAGTVGTAGPGAPASPSLQERRGKLDKSQSTPAYDLGPPLVAGSPTALVTQIIPESPGTPTNVDSPTIFLHSAEKADQILDFKKSSSAIGEAILQQRGRRYGEPSPAHLPAPAQLVEALNTALLGTDVGGTTSPSILIQSPSMPTPPPRPLPILRILPRHAETNDKPKEMARVSKSDIQVVCGVETQPLPLPALNATPDPPPDMEPPLLTHVQPVVNHSNKSSIFPSSKTKSLKKKNSLLAKRRAVAWRAVAVRGAGGAAPGAAVYQRVRGRGAPTCRWARRHLLLADCLLYAYRSPECTRADCMINLAGFTVCAATEVKSRAHAFKVYHTGTAFYFAADTRDAMQAWIQLLQRATLLPASAPIVSDQLEIAKQFSETDYSETESDNESSERCLEREREREKENKDKDKSKFGSLKKLTSRMTRSESSEAVAAASLDRKYLRFFSRPRNKEEKSKSKSPSTPVPTEQYRSYRRPPAAVTPPPPPPPPRPHASHPNLAHTTAHTHRRRTTRRTPDNLLGFVTLEEFMLKKQEEERRQVYTNRVLMGVERSAGSAPSPLTASPPWERIVCEVIYGELPPAPPAPPPEPRALPPPPPSPTASTAHSPPQTGPKPISVKGKDGYEKLVYPEEIPRPETSGDRWRDSLRRNDKVHTSGTVPLKPASTSQDSPTNDSWQGVGSGGGVSRLRVMFGGRGGASTSSSSSTSTSTSTADRYMQVQEPTAAGRRAGTQYPHLQCPPTFQPETYSLSRLHPHHNATQHPR